MADKKILVVDDEPGILKALSLRLGAKKYVVVTGTNGEQALSQVEAENPDLVILDVMMPPPNGFEVCRKLKEKPEYKKIPIILLTAKATDGDKFWGTDAGADAYVTKPYNSEDLLNKVEELLAN